MEVHHHPQLEHKPKPWKEYLLEGLMIFLAVMMGFFAESLRESISDRAKENEYIRSMIEDTKADTANIHHAIKLDWEILIHDNEMATLCFNFDAAAKNDYELYLVSSKLGGPTGFINPTEKTLTQLKNAGGMRLIRKKAAIDSIMLYDDFAKEVLKVQTYYERFSLGVADLSMQLFNFNSLSAGNVSPSVKMLIRDNKQVIQFGNNVKNAAKVLSYQIIVLQQFEQHAINLMSTLRKEYHVEDE